MSGDLFDGLPEYPPALPDDELELLRDLPDWDTVQEVPQGLEAAARRLAARGLVKTCRWRDDPISTHRTLYAGRLPAAALRSAT